MREDPVFPVQLDICATESTPNQTSSSGVSLALRHKTTLTNQPCWKSLHIIIFKPTLFYLAAHWSDYTKLSQRTKHCVTFAFSQLLFLSLFLHCFPALEEAQDLETLLQGTVGWLIWDVPYGGLHGNRGSAKLKMGREGWRASFHLFLGKDPHEVAAAVGKSCNEKKNKKTKSSQEADQKSSCIPTTH